MALKKQCSTYGLAALTALLLLLVLPAASVLADPHYDLGGETVRIQTRFAQTTPLGAEGQFDWYDPDPRLQAHIDSVEEMFNAKIEFVEPGEWWWSDQGYLLSHILAGELPFHYFDIEVQWGFMYNQAVQGTLLPLDNILEQDFYAGYPPSFRTDLDNPSFMFDGSVYGFESKNYAREPVGILWNIDMFEREGLPNLYDLYESGDWTWEKLADIARQATRDTTGDGEIDQVGLLAEVGKAFTTAVHSFGGSFNREVEGRQEFFVDDAAFEALEFVANMFKEDVGDTNFWPRRLRGDYAMGLWYALDVQWGVQEATEDDYGIVPLPRGPRAEEHIVDAWNQWMGALPITVPVEDARAIIEVVRALWQTTEPYIEDIDLWEQDHWDGILRYVPDRRSAENLQWMYQNTRFYMPAHIDQALRLSGWEWGHFYNQVVNSDYSISAYIAERQPAIQAALDTLLDQ